MSELFSQAIAVAQEGHFVFVNARAARYLGYENATELVGMTQDGFLQEHVLAEDRPILIEQCQNAASRRAESTTRFRRRDGSVIVAECKLAPLLYGGKPALAWLSRELTRDEDPVLSLARVERAAALGKLAAGVAHEINNPLTFMAMNLDMALEELRSLQGPRFDPATGAMTWPASKINSMLNALAEVREGIHRVERTVEDLKLLAFSENSKAPAAQPRAAMEAALAALRSTAEPEVEIRTSYEPTAPVRGTDAWLTKTFVHVLENAEQALRGKGAPRRLEITIRQLTSAAVRVTVQDTGVGIAPEDLGRVFDPFYTTKPHGQARGLGLTMAHAIVAALGGSIEVTSELGAGTRVVIELPTRP